MEESEIGRKWKWKKVKVEESESREGVGTVTWRKEIKKWKWEKVRRELGQRVSTVTWKNESEKRGWNQNGRKWKGGKKLWNYQTEISQWKSESKSVKSKSENSVSKWKVKVVMGNVRSRGGAGIATGWKVKKCEEKYKRSNGRLWALSASTDSTLRVLSIRVPKDITPRPKRQSYQLK